MKKELADALNKETNKLKAKQAKQIKQRLEYLRSEIRSERISYEELAQLQSLIPYIEPGDVELLEAAGVPEFSEASHD